MILVLNLKKNTKENYKMTHEEKINYMRIATRIVGYSLDEKGLDMLISIYELIIDTQGETDLSLIFKIQSDVNHRAKERLSKDSIH